ncbi:MAG TPA: carbamoyltransferase N-terminal domain-containing protein, partial [Blastocatellia bacterium]|nr:carbamoyltransferase N-terminal domain-containing protein [Blastocatellia bacterium]
MSKDRDPWVLGISASHNGAVCLLKGDEIVVAIQEERLSRRKRQRIFGAQHSLSLDYCFDYAGIQPRDLSMIVISVQGRLKSSNQDLTLNPLLKVKEYGIPTLAISHHFAHAVST